jgi:transposase
MTNPSRRVAGIDTGKAHLEIAVHRRSARWRVENTPQGWALLITHLRAEGVSLIGIEATGGYERGVVEALRAAGLRVVVHQPLQIKAFAKMRLRRAKNDRLDAALIAAFTDLLDPERAEREPPDPRLAPLADRLVFIKQAHEDSARAILRLEHQPDPRLRAQLEEDECRAKERARRELKALVADIRAHHPDLAHRLELLLTIPGIGLPTAVHLVVQMPELGRISREEAAALAGLAPFDDDTGQHSGERHIMGGRARVRTALYAAALPASYRWNPALMALRNRLRAKGKPHKKALVAVARKLLVYANAVLARGTPWCEHAPARAAG